jgi:hypothetical protein
MKIQHKLKINKFGIEKIMTENNIKHSLKFILDTIQTHPFLCSALLRRKL